MTNRILCDACFRRIYPQGREEKSCIHGFIEATCVECGKTRVSGEQPLWHCLGTVKEPSSAEQPK